VTVELVGLAPVVELVEVPVVELPPVVEPVETRQTSGTGAPSQQGRM
jgi:hypothetical protein